MMMLLINKFSNYINICFNISSINSIIVLLFIMFCGVAKSDDYRILCDDRDKFFQVFRKKILNENAVLKFDGAKVISDNLSRGKLSTHIRGKLEFLKRYSDIDISITTQGVSTFFILPANDIKNFLLKNSEFIELFLPDRDIQSRIDWIKKEDVVYSFIGFNNDDIVSGFLIIENEAKDDLSIKEIDKFFNKIFGLNEMKIFNDDEAGFGFNWTDLMFLKLIYSSRLAPEDLLSGSERAYEAARNSRFCR
jgi:hypothetical protein